MYGTLSDAENTATNATFGSGSELSNTLASGSNRDAWFFEAAQDLLGKDAGYLLHRISGYPESSCYAYTTKKADKRRPVPEHLLRNLIHSEQGEPWHNAFMHGCKAKWWLARERERQLAVLARNIFDQVGEVVSQPETG
jgi:hypothetical protein